MGLDDTTRNAITRHRQALDEELAKARTATSRIRELLNFDENYPTRLTEAEVLEILEAERATAATAAGELRTLATSDLGLEPRP